MHDNSRYRAVYSGENMVFQPLTPSSRRGPAPRGLTLLDLARIRSALERSTSANTLRAYDLAWRRWVAWTEVRRCRAVPAKPEMLAAFLTELAEQGLSVATLRLQKAALSRAHRSIGHPDPTDTEGVRRVMAGIAREHGRPQRQAKPLTEAALAAVRVTAAMPRGHQGQHQGRHETSWKAQRRGRVDVALMSVLRDGLLRRSEAAELRWGDVEFREDGSALLQVRRSKTDPEAEGVVLYIGQEAAQALRALMPEGAAVVDPESTVFGLSASQIGRRIKAAAQAAGLGEGFTGHSGRVGMAQDLAATGVDLPALMTAGRWKSSRMPAKYTERQAAGRGAVARYYQRRGG